MTALVVVATAFLLAGCAFVDEAPTPFASVRCRTTPRARTALAQAIKDCRPTVGLNFRITGPS